jgi:hypothetical protein
MRDFEWVRAPIVMGDRGRMQAADKTMPMQQKTSRAHIAQLAQNT